ncbi:MAG: hypothetical protein QGH82_03515 [Candidatus Woesearchaeota archaeon]|nr:hypothetical protein [Candidatus Woesearchaeota archaeon]
MKPKPLRDLNRPCTADTKKIEWQGVALEQVLRQISKVFKKDQNGKDGRIRGSRLRAAKNLK